MKFLAVFSIIAVIAMAGCVQNGTNSTAGPLTGRVIVTITDAAADINSISSIKATIDKVEIHSESQGWVTLSAMPKTYDLLELKAQDSQALLADAQLNEEKYNQIRLHVSKITITDIRGDHEAKLPSNEFKTNIDMNTKTQTTSAIIMDFKADESLHVTGQAEYVFAPVVMTDAKENVRAEIATSGSVELRGGTTRSSEKAGMDINGNVAVGLSIPAGADLSISGGSVVITGQALGGFATIPA